MKFILNEHKKFILEERFILKEEEILTEASVADIALKWTSTFKNTLDNTKAVLTKYNNFANISNFSKEVKAKFTKLQSEITTASGEIEVSLLMPETELASNLPAVKAELEGYIKALQLVIPEITDKKSKDTITLLKSKIDDLKKINAEETWKKPETTELKEIMDWVEAKIYPLFDISSIEDTELKVEDFKKLCVDCLALIKNIEENLPEAFDNIDADALKNYILIMKEASENTKLTDASKINKGLVIANLDNYLKNITILKRNYEKINNASVLEIVKTKKAEEEQAKKDAEEKAKRAEDRAAKLKTASGEDWTTKYNSAVDKEVVWSTYLNTYWSSRLSLSEENFSRILKISDALRQECLAYGFDNSNPFFEFVEKQYLTSNMTSDCYNAIHNAVEDNYLTTKDLRGIGNLGYYNIIFCEQFKTTSYKNAFAYLKKQYNLFKKAVPKEFDSREEFTINLMYNVDKVIENATIKANIEAKTEAALALKLSSFARINELEQRFTGDVSSTEDEKNKTEINDSLVNQIANLEEATTILTVLAVKFAAREKIVNLVQQFKEVNVALSKPQSALDLQKMIKNIDTKFKLTGITENQAIELIKKITSSNKFKFTK